MSTNIAVLASGRGSNFDAICAAIEARRLDAKIVALVTDRPDAPVVKKAEDRGIVVIARAWPKSGIREEHEQAWLSSLPLEPDWYVLAGYMRILSPGFLKKMELEQGVARVVNIHPSLLPAFTGRGGYSQALSYGCHVAGATVHLVTPELDSGPICAQESFVIPRGATEEDVEKVGLALEHTLYPKALKWILAREFSLERTNGGRLCVRKN